MDKLREYCVNSGVDFLKPILDVPTRWNSLADLLATAIKLKEPLMFSFSQFKSEDWVVDHLTLVEKKQVLSKKSFAAPTLVDWDMFEELLAFLTPFREATLETNGEKMSTLPLVIPWYNIILDHCEHKRVRSC